MALGALGSYLISDKMRERWQVAGATYAWMNEHKELYYKLLAQKAYEWYLNGKLKELVEQGRQEGNVLEPPPDFIVAKEDEIRRMVQEYNRNKNMRNVTPRPNMNW
jgi:hypothetical protein